MPACGKHPVAPRHMISNSLHMQMYEPLPFRQMNSGMNNMIKLPSVDQIKSDMNNKKTDTQVACMYDALTSCSRRFSGPGFRSCIFGMLTASNLLPTGTATRHAIDMLDEQGGYVAGLTYNCS